MFNSYYHIKKYRLWNSLAIPYTYFTNICYRYLSHDLGIINIFLCTQRKYFISFPIVMDSSINTLTIGFLYCIPFHKCTQFSIIRTFPRKFAVLFQLRHLSLIYDLDCYIIIYIPHVSEAWASIDFIALLDFYQ